MASISAKVKSFKRADGTYQICVGVSHKNKTCYIPTNISVTNPKHLQGTSIVKESDSAFKTRELTNMVDKYCKALYVLGDVESYTCVQLKQLLITHDLKKSVTLYEIKEEYISNLKRDGRIPYANILDDSYKRWSNVIPGNTLVKHITPFMVEDLKTSLLPRYSVAMVSTTLSHLKVLVNYSIKMMYVRYDIHPFIRTIIQRCPVRELNLEVVDFKKIYDYKPQYNYDKFAKDMFLLSFFTGGTNFADIVEFQYKKGDDTLSYVRKKARGRTSQVATVTIPVIAEARVILDKYVKRGGGLDLGYNFDYANLISFLGRSLKKLVKTVGIDYRVVFMTARKAFAQFGLDCEIPDSIIDYCLGHSNSGRGIISYYSKVRVRQAGEALRTIADYALSNHAD